MKKGLINKIIKVDPAARNACNVILNYPGVHAVFFYRIYHFLWCMHIKTIARFLSQVARFLTGIEIHPGAIIGARVFIDHGMGIVIGETAIIGDDCTLYQGVTLGGIATGEYQKKRHPTLQENVTVFSGAKIIGNVIIGKNSVIGAMAVVLEDIPINCTAIGIPAKIVKRDGKRVNEYR